MARTQVPDILKRYIEDFLGKRIRRGQISNKFEVGYAMERLEKAINRYLGNPEDTVKYLKALYQKNKDVMFFLGSGDSELMFNHLIENFLKNIKPTNKNLALDVAKKKELTQAFMKAAESLLEKVEVSPQS